MATFFYENIPTSGYWWPGKNSGFLLSNLSYMKQLLSLYKFRKLSRLEQSIFVWEQGSYLTNRIEGGKKFLLFQVAAFYVEISFDLKEESFNGLRSFNSTNQLKPFLQGINITTLLPDHCP